MTAGEVFGTVVVILVLLAIMHVLLDGWRWQRRQEDEHGGVDEWDRAREALRRDR